MNTKHQAAVLPHKGGPLSITERDTPEPGPNEVLLEVKAVALNPVDYFQRDLGIMIPGYPYVLGSDVAGRIAKIGSDVSSSLAPKARVVAFASAFYQSGSPSHGAFQQYVLAQSEAVIVLPDSLSFAEGALLPMAVLTALSSWTSIGIPINTKYSPEEKQSVLIWGGASSVGSMTIQSAKLMDFTIYTTASARHHEYIRGLGADFVFDYNDSDVISQIVESIRKNGHVLHTACAVVPGSLQPTLDVLKHTRGDAIARVAHAPPLLPGAPTMEGAEIKFVMPPMDVAERSEHMRKCFHVWLRDGLDSGTVVPSPHVQVEAGGLQGLDKALNVLKAGISGVKIVVPI